MVLDGFGAGGNSRSGFWKSLRTPLLVSVLVQLAIAPFTSLPGDVAVWLVVSERAMAGIGLYRLTGFSYPPLYGYWCMALGGAAHLLGLQNSALGGQDSHLLQSGFLAGNSVVTTPLFTLLLKLPMIGADCVAGYYIWRIALHLGGGGGLRRTRRARVAFVWWALNPLVIVESAVHGQIDALAACAIAAGIAYALEDRWGLAGVAIALGVAADVSPAFLVLPLLGYAVARGRWRRSSAFVAGGVVAGAITLSPVIASGLIENVFTRVAVGASIGGLGLTGLTSLLFLGGVGQFFVAHSAAVGQVGDFAMLATGLFVGLWLARGRSGVSLVRGCFLTMGIVLIVSPVVNPQYLLWIVPFFALGASGVLTAWKRELRIGMVCVAIGGIGYLLALFGWAELMAPSSFAFGWPSPHTIAALSTALSTRTNAWPLPATLRSKLALLCTIFVLAGGIVAVVGTVKGRGPSGQADALADERVAPRRYWQLLAASGLFIFIEAFGLVAPALTPSPAISATVVASSARSATISVTTRHGEQARFAAFAMTKRQRIRRVLYYYSPTRPDSGAENSTVIGTEQALQELLGKLSVVQVDARTLPGALRQPGSGTMLVDVAGTLPNTIWGGAQSQILLAWIKSGGIVALAGDVPGFYSVSPGPMTVRAGRYLAPNVTAVGNDALLPPGVVGGSAFWNAAPATRPSAWGTGLGLTYTYDAVPLFTDQILAHHGTILGLIGRDYTTSEAFVPLGRGGIVDFAGFDLAQPIAEDISHLILSNFFSHIGDAVATTVVSAHGTLHISVPRGTKGIEIFAAATNPFAVWTRSKELPWNG